MHPSSCAKLWIPISTNDREISMGEPVSIDRYRVVRKLGEGGMGEVFLAHDEALGRSVAIKRLLTRGAPNLHERRERFLREGRKLARLKHPHIVKVFDILDAMDPPAIVMEYIEGWSLRAYIAGSGALPPRQVVRLGLQIADAMAEIHAHGIVHRDLKSENVLVDRAGNATVTDFGIARAAGDETLTAEGAILGTPGAMSPEQMSGKDAGEASDLFLLGILLYEALTGKRPFRGTRDEILLALSTYEPPSPIACNPAVPEGLSNLVDHLLKKMPMSRPRSFRKVVETLKQIGAELDSESAIPAAVMLVEIAAPDDSQATEDPVERPEGPEAPEGLIARLAARPEAEPDAETLASQAEAVAATEPSPPRVRIAERAGADARDSEWRAASNAEDSVVHPRERRDTSQGLATGDKQRIRTSGAPRRTALMLGAASAVSALVAGAFYLQWPPDDSEPTEEHRDDHEPPDPTPAPGPYRKLHPPEPKPAELRYVAVKVDVPESCPTGARFVTRSVRSAMEEPLFGLQGVLVVSKLEPELKRLRSESDGVAREVLAAEVACHPNRVDIDIWREVDGVMHQTRRSFTIDVSDLGRSDAIQNQVRLLYDDIEPTEPTWRGQAQESSVQELREVTREYWQEPPDAPIERFLERLAAIRATSPQFVDAYIFEAELLQHRYRQRKTPDMVDLDRAWALAKQAENIDPSWQPTLTRLFSIALAYNDITEAERVLDQLEQTNPDDGFTHYMRGLLRDNQDDTRGAHQAFRAAAERHPSWRILYYRTKLDMARCELDEAREGLADLEEHWPDIPAVLQLKGQFLGRTDPVAAATFFLGLPDDPGFSKIANQGVLLISLQSYREAIRLLEKAIASKGRSRAASLRAIFNMGEAYKLLGQENQAKRYFDEVLSLFSADKRDSSSMALRALTYAHLGQAAKAREAIALALKREDMDIYHAAATVYAIIGDTDEARGWTARALDCGYAREWFHYPWFEAVRQP
jgi:tetratricopeptide (TPR) repeat protein